MVESQKNNFVPCEAEVEGSFKPQIPRININHETWVESAELTKIEQIITEFTIMFLFNMRVYNKFNIWYLVGEIGATLKKTNISTHVGI
jgi:hypothetical protein